MELDSAPADAAELTVHMNDQPGSPDPPSDEVATERCFTSRYAPLNAGGCLAPGVTREVVAESYRAFFRGERLRVILAITGIPKQSGESVVTSLRRALDEPTYRRGLHRGKRFRPPFSLLLHTFLISSGRFPESIYRDLIRPVLRTADELFRFDAEQFGSLIGEQLAMGKVFAPVVDPWSEEEALALFTLAWALRKPGQAHAILAPVLRLGPQFLDFFGAREGSAASAYGEEEGESDEGQASAEEDDDPEEENLAVGQVLDEEIAPADGAAVAGIEEEIEETEPGPRGAELASRQGALESAADRRRQVGGSSTLDVRAIKLALEAETGAQERLADTQQRISAELQNKLTDLRSVLEGAGVPRFAPPVLADARDMAAWLDRTSQEMEKVLAEGRELQRLRGLLVETGGRLPDPPSAPPWPFSTAGALTFLREIAAAVDRAFGEARRERETLEAMRERFADCLSPRRAKSIGRLDAQSTRELLQAAQGDETTRQLTPALCRRLSDVEEWDTSSPAAGSLELLGHCLEQAAMHGESEHQAAPSFLPRRTLEALLASGHEMVARHLVLITFRESLARPHPFFFEVIWPYEKGWANRQRCVGERLHRLFTDLQMLFWEAGLQPVLEALVSNGSEEASGAEEADRLSARAKRQAAENLAVRLETVSMSGHYHRVRQLACNLFFRPLTDSIRERRVREVQSQLALLQRRFASGELEQVAVREYPERNELRSEHRVSLRRYLEANLDAVDQWVRQEASLLRSRTIEDEDKLHKEVRTALARLPSLPHADHEELGSVEWLEHAVGEAIVALRQNRGPRSTCLLFGDLPPLETLFAGAHASGSTNTSGVPWPPWLDADPRSERIWCSYVHGAASWQDLLHDGIAKQLLGRRRSPREVMESLLAAGEFEAAVQAARYPGFGGEAIAGFAAQAAEAAARRGRLERQQEDLDRRLRSLERSANSESLRQILEHLPAALLELIDLAEVDLDAAARRCEEIAGELGRIEERVQSEESDKRERFEWLRSWLAGAGVGLAAGADLAEAEGKIVQIRERERPRRLHLLRLSELDAANVPEPLRSAVHSFLAGADRPDRWLTREESERIDLYLDYLVDAARGWWEMLRGLDQEDGTFRKIQEIAALLAERLPEEMAALAEQREDSAPMLTLAAEWRGQPTAAEYYRALQERQLLGDEEETIAAEAAEIQVEAVPAWVQLQARIERSMMHGPGVGPVTGRLVQEAFTAFGEERYEAAAELARAAWSWARGNGAAGEIGPLVAVYNWSCLQHDGAGFERSKVEALGLVLRNLPRIRERARLQPEKWLAWWNQVMAETPQDGRADPAGESERAAGLLNRMAEAPAGAEIRERMAALLRIADASAMADLLWEAVTGLKEAARPRTALLLLLSDLGEDDALRHLFRHAGGHRKYLVAFTALASRARSEPSAKLHAAIHHNLQTLRDLKDRPFKDFAERLTAKLQYVPARVRLDAAEILEQSDQPGTYILVVSLEPDETDPPLSLSVELSPEGDFVEAAKGSGSQQVVREGESPLFDRRELEFKLRPQGAAASHVALRVTGETASGQQIEGTHRRLVRLGTEAPFQPLPIDELLEIYSGCDAKPVSGPAFVGREEELEILRRSVARDGPGAMIVYGVRRLGKTSLLDELRRRNCLTSRPDSQTLFLAIPMDEFNPRDETRPFLGLLLEHIKMEVREEAKNAGFRSFLARLGISASQLQAAGQLDGLEGGSFLVQLRRYVQRLRELSGGRVHQVVLVLDEFDKLLERYHSGFEADVEMLTNQLRKAATEEPDLGLVLAGSDLMRWLFDGYRNAMFGSAQRLSLECFIGERHRDAARSIVAPEGLGHRLHFSEPVIDDIVRITGGHPLYMRMVACAAAFLSRYQRVSRGTIIEAVQSLLRNRVLQGYVAELAHQVYQQVQVLRLLPQPDCALAELLLLQLARHTELERSWTNWQTVVDDDRLKSIRPEKTWVRLRQVLADAKLIEPNARRLWGFRFPIVGERLRIGLEVEFDRLQAMVELSHEARGREMR